LSAIPKSGSSMSCLRTKSKKRVYAAFARVSADFGMHGGTVFTDLAHSAKHQGATPRQRGQHIDGGAHGIGIGIVAVIDQLVTVRQCMQLHPPGNWIEGFQTACNRRQGRACRQGTCRCRERIAQVMHSGSMQSEHYIALRGVQTETSVGGFGAN